MQLMRVTRKLVPSCSSPAGCRLQSEGRKQCKNAEPECRAGEACRNCAHTTNREKSISSPPKCTAQFILKLQTYSELFPWTPKAGLTPRAPFSNLIFEDAHETCANDEELSPSSPLPGLFHLGLNLDLYDSNSETDGLNRWDKMQLRLGRKRTVQNFEFRK